MPMFTLTEYFLSTTMFGSDLHITSDGPGIGTQNGGMA